MKSYTDDCCVDVSGYGGKCFSRFLPRLFEVKSGYKLAEFAVLLQ